MSAKAKKSAVKKPVAKKREIKVEYEESAASDEAGDPVSEATGTAETPSQETPPEQPDGISLLKSLTITDNAKVIVPIGVTLTVNGTAYTDCTLTASSL